MLIVIELAAGGDLLSYVRKRRTLKEEVAKSLFKQLVTALSYCHQKGIVHRDIKLDNLLLTIDGQVKICDFGVSKQTKPGEVMTERCGTPAYIAPEVLQEKGYSGCKSDLWSAGVVLYAMLYGSVPFKANNMAELQDQIRAGDYKLKDTVPAPARDLISKILEIDPKKRLSSAQILSHPWMLDAKDSVELFTGAEKNYMLDKLKSFTIEDTSDNLPSDKLF